MTKTCLVCLVATQLFVALPAHATTYYMANNPCSGNPGWGNGANAADGLSKSAPFLTLTYALGKMTAGDTLVIDDGIYTGSENGIEKHMTFPSGNSGDDGEDGTEDDVYTTIMAEHDGEVIFEGQSFQIYGDVTVDGIEAKNCQSNTAPCPPKRFSIFRGLIIRGGRSSFSLQHTRYVKLINCGATLSETANSGQSIITAGRCEYILLEGVYTWGTTGYYAIQLTDVEHSIIRNCVVRYDHSLSASAQSGAITNYSCAHNEIQNSIVIDGNTGWQHLGNFDGNQGCFGNPGTHPRNLSYGPLNFTNCIALNNTQRFSTCDTFIGVEETNDCRFNNCIAWDMVTPPISVDNEAPNTLAGSAKAAYNQCTFGDVETYNGEPPGDVPNRHYIFGGRGTMQNSVLHNMAPTSSNALFWTFTELTHLNVTGYPDREDYNLVFYNSSFPEYTDEITSLSTYPITSKYLVKMDTPELQTSGTDGGRIGATILYQYGKSGTMWGEPGYDQLQDGTNGQRVVKMWPFPNEEKVREMARTYSFSDSVLPDIDGKRGFSKDGDTLTNYVWSYWGNTPPPFEVAGIPGNTTATISWARPADVALATLTEFRVYEIDGATRTLRASIPVSNMSPTTYAEISSLQNGTIYQFAVTAVDETKGESGYVYPVTVVPKTDAGVASDAASNPDANQTDATTTQNSHIDGGCGCSQTNGSNPTGADWLLLLFIVPILRRRRRS